MKLGKYIILALLFFLAGLAALYSGVNRAPFRQTLPEHSPKQHGQAPLSRITTEICSLQDRLPPEFKEV
jgi:hypothetical protein